MYNTGSNYFPSQVVSDIEKLSLEYGLKIANAIEIEWFDKSYNGKEEQYDIGSLVGVNITNRIGVFLEGSKLKYYGREEYTVSTGINLKF